MKKNLVVTITIVTALSLSILTGCGNTQTTSSDPLTTPSTTIEQTIDMTDGATTTYAQEATETFTEPTELEDQDKDPTEATTQGTTQSPTTQPTTTTQTTESTKPAHVHTWTTETYYTTENQVIHHDAVTHQETVTTYTTTTVYYEAEYRCRTCAAIFTSPDADKAAKAANAHIESNIDCLLSGAGFVGSPGGEVETQVPHTETVTVVDQEAWDETVEIQVPHTRTVCSECGATK